MAEQSSTSNGAGSAPHNNSRSNRSDPVRSQTINAGDDPIDDYLGTKERVHLIFYLDHPDLV